MNQTQVFSFNIKLLYVILICLFSPTLFAAEQPTQSFTKKPFLKTTFDQLQAEGRPVLVDVYASWCPTCERQQWILQDYFVANPDSQLTVLVVDFDEDKQWVKFFKAPRQSTLLLFSQGQRAWFSVAETRKRVIFDALSSVE